MLIMLKTRLFALSAAVLAALGLGLAVAAASPKPPENPAVLDVKVDPPAVSPGAEARVTVKLVPQSGIKINRYPKMKLTVPVLEGVVASAEVAVGNDAPPPPDRLDDNYYQEVDPLVLALAVDPGAASGAHKVPAKLRYFYCVTASGFCAPKQATLEIPIHVSAR